MPGVTVTRTPDGDSLGAGSAVGRVLGDGWRFVEDPAFAREPLPVDLAWVSTSTSDAAGRLLTFQRSSPTVVVREASGAFVEAFDVPGCIDAHGITVAPDGSLLLVDRDGQQVLRHDGDVTTRLFEGFRFGYPTAIVVHGATGDYFVSDGYGNAKVHRFDASGAHLKSWGRNGTRPGEFNVVHALSFDSRGRLIVADRENGRLQLFDTDGECLDVWDGYYRPLGLAIDGVRDLVFVSEGSTRLSARSLDGDEVAVGRGPDIVHGLSCDGDALYLTSPALKTVIKLVRIDDRPA
jgi:DNA-binding beta-propeller fold protein YncE